MNWRMAVCGTTAFVASCMPPSGRGIETAPHSVGWLEAFTADDTVAIAFGWLGVAVADNLLIPMKAGEGALEVIGGVARAGGVVIALDLKVDTARAWLAASSNEQRRQLRFVHVPDDLAPAPTAALRALARLKPEVSVGFKSDSVAARILPLFRPRILVLESSLTAQQAATQPQLEILLMSAVTAGSVEALGQLTNLRHLFLGDWHVPTAGQLPPKLRLESLSARAAGDRSERILNLDTFRGVRRLFLSNFIVDAGGSNNNRLHTLDLSLSELRGGPGLSHLKSLRRYGLPRNTTRQDLTTLVASHPRLEAVALVEMDSLTDIAPLLALPDLREVVMTEEFDGIERLGTMRSLRYLGLPTDMWDKKPAQVASLKAALPQTAIVKISTYCLGSGWILLVVIAGGAGIAARRRSATA